jgi:hypothetical protein
MHRMKRILVVITAVALTVSFMPIAPAATPKINWSTTHKIIYVGLTPADQSDFWTAYDGETTTGITEGEMTTNARGTVAEAIKYWKQASRGKMKFGAPKFFFGKPGTAVKHCNFNADTKTAMKIAGLKSIPTGTHLIAVNIYDSCGYAGLGEQGGGSINLKSFNSTTLIHELGHNFNFYHSSNIYCDNSDYTKFNAANCSVNEYGDFRDLMGSDDWCPGATLSATQRATTFFTPKAKNLTIGVDTTVDESRLTSDNIVYQFLYKGNFYFFEYYIPGEERCISINTFLDKPQIQLRMIGPAWTRPKGKIVGPMLIHRHDDDFPTSVVDLNLDPEAEPSDWILTGFLEGETFKLPGAPYVLTVKSTGTTSAVITLIKS